MLSNLINLRTRIIFNFLIKDQSLLSHAIAIQLINITKNLSWKVEKNLLKVLIILEIKGLI